MAVTATADQLFEALAADQRYAANPELLEILRPYVALLPEIVGKELMGKIVNLQVGLDATLVIARVLTEEYDLASKFPVMSNILRDQWRVAVSQYEMISKTPQMILFLSGLSEEDFMLSDEMGMSESQKARYRKGELTLGEFVTESPGEFLEFVIL